VKVCIHESRTLNDPNRQRHCTQAQHLKSAEEMHELFADLPEALENTLEIAKRCNVTLELDDYHLPEYPVPEGATIESVLEDAAREGLEARLATIFDTRAPGETTAPTETAAATEPAATTAPATTAPATTAPAATTTPAATSPDLAKQRQPYDERLTFELAVINKMGFPGYFLIVMEFIQWAKDNDIPVGPGRGSGAGSLVAYALGITDIDPLEYDLLFERFLNPERVSLPDFDIDFCMDGRDRVIQHVSERYGREAVSQIITFGTMAAKAVVRDVARVQGKPYSLADKLSKLIPFDVGITLAKAMEQEPLLQEFVATNDDAQEIMTMAYQLEGLARNIGRHAGGVVIAPTRLTDYAPTWCDKSGGSLM
ncbi:MAG: hypothetical protein ACR2PJ_01155, partial [Pseudomonadales bacterium]